MKAKLIAEFFEAKGMDFSEAKIDDAGVIKNVHFVGYQAKNTKIKAKGPYKYTKSALEEAVKSKVHDGIDVYLGHSKDKTRDRDPVDKIGYTSNITFQEASGIHGDIVCNVAHPHYPAVKWWAENQPKRLGASHIADCTFDEEANEIVEIERAKSLDLVSNPSTTSGLFAEGIIADEVALKDDACRLQDLMDAFNTLMYEARWPLGESLTAAATAVRVTAVVKDLALELEKFKPTNVEESIMDLTKLTLAELKTARPDLVATVCTEAVTAERTLDNEVEEAVKELPIEARTPAFKKMLRLAKKAGEDLAPLVADRKTVKIEASESVLPGQAAGVVKPIVPVIPAIVTPPAVTGESILASITNKK